MRKISISGGPHTGKSTMMEALAETYPEAHFLPEPATQIITRELAKQETGKDLSSLILPWVDVRRFDEAVIDEYEAQEASLPEGDGIAFQDRSLWDSVHYCRIDGCHDLIPGIESKARAAKYAFALICEPVGTYTQSEVRTETAKEALATHYGTKAIYLASGLPVISLPNVSTEQRLTIVENALQAALA